MSQASSVITCRTDTVIALLERIPRRWLWCRSVPILFTRLECNDSFVAFCRDSNSFCKVSSDVPKSIVFPLRVPFWFISASCFHPSSLSYFSSPLICCILFVIGDPFFHYPFIVTLFCSI
ncbi:hypothetical protein GPALN_004548 [Globodera pallida]|nr:hypothetical protein GPALN_004548 [Globodera pallida]